MSERGLTNNPRGYRGTSAVWSYELPTHLDLIIHREEIEKDYLFVKIPFRYLESYVRRATLQKKRKRTR